MQVLAAQQRCCAPSEAARPLGSTHPVLLQAQHSGRIGIPSLAQRPEPCGSASYLPAGPCSRDGEAYCWTPDALGGYRLALGRAALLQLQLEEPPTPKLKDTENLKRKLERDLQFGQAIRILREDIPSFFKIRRPQDMSIFTDDVVFIDNITPYLGLEAFNTSSQGKSKYKRRLNALRALVVCLFQVDMVHVHRFWQRSDGVVAVRWAVHGQPRLIAAEQRTVDGISEFRFNSEGYIYQHTVDVIDWEGLRPKQRQAVPVLNRTGSFT